MQINKQTSEKFITSL